MRTLENKDGSNTVILFDVRSPIDSTGEILFPPDYPTELREEDTYQEQRTSPIVKLSVIMTAHPIRLTN